MILDTSSLTPAQTELLLDYQGGRFSHILNLDCFTVSDFENDSLFTWLFLNLSHAPTPSQSPLDAFLDLCSSALKATILIRQSIAEQTTT